jgi:hypothetical protein
MKNTALFLLLSFLLFGSARANKFDTGSSVSSETACRDSLHSRHAGDSIRFHNWKAGLSFSNLGESVPSLEVHFPYQQFTDVYQPNVHSSSYTAGLFLERRIRHSLSVRVSAGYCRMSTTYHYDSRVDGQSGTTNYMLSDYSASQQIYYGAAGISKSLIRARRANIYAGIDLLLLLRRNNRQEYNDTDYMLNGNPNGSSHSLLTGTDAYCAGINPFLGFEYKVCRRLSLGFEISDPFLYTHVYGSQVVETDGTGIITQTTTSPNDYKNLSFSNASFRLQAAFVF